MESNQEVLQKIRANVYNALEEQAASVQGMLDYLSTYKFLISTVENQLHEAIEKIKMHEDQLTHLHQGFLNNNNALKNIFSENPVAPGAAAPSHEHHMVLQAQEQTIPGMLDTVLNIPNNTVKEPPSLPQLEVPDEPAPPPVLNPKTNAEPVRALNLSPKDVFIGELSIWARLFNCKTYPFGRGEIDVKKALNKEINLPVFTNDIEVTKPNDIAEYYATGFYRNSRNMSRTFFLRLKDDQHPILAGVLMPDLSDVNAEPLFLCKGENDYHLLGMENFTEMHLESFKNIFTPQFFIEFFKSI